MLPARPPPLNRGGYHLPIVGPAPLPPHERPWRHPSELAPTAADVDVDTPVGARVLILATGAAAALIAVVMVVALGPGHVNSPTALRSTTLPPAIVQLDNASSQIGASSEPAQGLVQIARTTMTGNNALALVGAPNAISGAPVGDARDFDVASALPRPDERVIVLTLTHAYRIAWSDIDRIAAPDGSIVVTRDGALVATFVSGELRLLAE
jgi:hypothetical protein